MRVSVNRRPASTGAVMLFIVAAIWGATLSFTGEALSFVGVNSFLAWRFMVASIVLLPFLPKVKPKSITLANTVVAVGLGGVLYGVFYFQTAGLVTVTPAATGFVTGTNVVMVPLITWAAFRTKVSRRVWLGILLTMVGLAFVAGRGLFSPVAGYWKVLLSAFLIAVDIVAVERITNSVDAIWLAFVEILTVAVISIAFSASSAGFGTVKVLTSANVVAAVLFDGVLGSSFALWAQNHYQMVVESAQVAVIFSGEPIFGALVAWLFFGGAVTAHVVVGGVFVLLGMTIADEEAFEYLRSKLLLFGGRRN